MRKAAPIFFTCLILAAGWCVLAQRAHAAVQGSITIEQISPKSMGRWVLYSASGTVATSDDTKNKRRYSFTVTGERLGLLTISVTPPSGSSVKMSIYRNGTLAKDVVSRQQTIQMYPGESYRIILVYTFDLVGMLGITSDPPVLPFRVRGPNKLRLSGKTPHTFINLPFGRYTIYMGAAEGCIQPKPYNKVVRPDERTTIHISVDCMSQQADDGIALRERSKREIVEDARKRAAIEEARRRMQQSSSSSSSSGR